MERRCTKCGETKPTAEFYANPRYRDGLTYWCRTCFGAYCRAQRAAGRAWDQREPDEAAANKRRYRAEHPEYREREAERVRRNRAKKRAEKASE